MTPDQAKQICIEAHKGQWCRPSIFRIPEDGTVGGVNKHVAPTLATADFIIYRENKYSYNKEGILQKQQPYHTHPIAVANMMTTDEEKIVAYLHHVVKNTSAILVDGLHYYYVYFNDVEYEIKKNIYAALRLLTKLPNQSHEEYIKDISENKLATKVKIADMFHNLSTSTSEEQKAKYLKHIPTLLNAL